MEKEVGKVAGPHLHSSGAVEGTGLTRWGCSRAGQGHTRSVLISDLRWESTPWVQTPLLSRCLAPEPLDLEEPLSLLELH